MLQKLSAPAAEEEMKKTHEELLSELAAIPHSGGKSNSSSIIATVKGLHFVLDEIQVSFFPSAHLVEDRGICVFD